MTVVTIVGGGLAGSEAALQLADRGLSVRLFEMRPEVQTGAHRTPNLGEIVCSNSLKSTLLSTASGLLKAEMDLLGSRLLEIARGCAVPAGHALAVDRDIFAQRVSEAIAARPNIRVVRECVDTLDLPSPAVIATGPLTAPGLAQALSRHVSRENLYFYDAIAPSVDGDSVDTAAGFWASRYGKGDPDYFNIPLDRAQYTRLLEKIAGAEYVPAHDFEEEAYFEACLPIEVLAARGPDTLRHGPMKPRGLMDPKSQREPYAALQLRRESLRGSLLGLVGFQTRMTQSSQREMIRSLPGMAAVTVLRYGSIHRNMFLDIPRMCDPYLRDKQRDGLFYAGQICGVEGYVESIMSAMVVALSIFADERGVALSALPVESMMGALMGHVHAPSKRFQPMNANMGILPAPTRRHRGRRERNEAHSRRAIDAVTRWRERHAPLFPSG